MQIRSSPPEKQKGLRAQIRALQAVRRIVVKERDEAIQALEQCQAQHPSVSGFLVADSSAE